MIKIHSDIYIIQYRNGGIQLKSDKIIVRQ